MDKPAEIKKDVPSRNTTGANCMRIENILALAIQEKEGIEIPQVLIERLEPFGSRFVKVAPPQYGVPKSGKAPIEKGFQKRPYEANDPELKRWLTMGGNYGILLGQGIAAIELDNKKLVEKAKGHIKTFTTQSGSGRGIHMIVRTDVKENGVIMKKGKNLGNIQVHDKIIVGPNSHHFTGGVYKIIDTSPLAWVSKEEMEELFGNLLSWAGERKKAELEQQAIEELEQAGVDIPISKVIELDDMHINSNGEHQGEHPVHGSETGQNFTVNTKKNCWHCFRCNSGGGPLMWIAVEEGILKCHEAQKGMLKGEKFLATIKKATERGFDISGLYDEELSPDVKRFFEMVGKIEKFIPAYLAKELMEKYTYITRIQDKMVFVYKPKEGIYNIRGEQHIRTQVRKMLGKHYSINRRRETVDFIISSTLQKIEEAPPELIAVENGILNIKTLEIQPFDPKHFIMNKLPVTYNPEADCPKFKKFLEEVVPTEPDRMTLQEYTGFCLRREYNHHKMLLLVGGGANGKSTFLNALRAFIGNDNICATPIQTFVTNRFAIARLFGKLANIYPDLPAVALKDAGIVKMICGEEPLEGENKFKESFIFDSFAKQIFSCNTIPPAPEDTDAFFRRWIIINFPNQFLEGDPKTDKNLKNKITTPKELSGILNWAIQGLERLEKQGHFTTGTSLEETRQKYITSTDPVKAFAENRLETDPENKITKNDLYEAFKTFCNENDVLPVSKTQFAIQIQKYVTIKDCWIKIAGKVNRAWQGVRLTVSPTNPPDHQGLRGQQGHADFQLDKYSKKIQAI